MQWLYENNTIIQSQYKAHSYKHISSVEVCIDKCEHQRHPCTSFEYDEVTGYCFLSHHDQHNNRKAPHSSKLYGENCKGMDTF
jgi:hypothetical protein